MPETIEVDEVVGSQKESPVTAPQLIRWGAIQLAVVGSLISGIWFIAGIKQDQAIQRDTIEQITKQIAENKSVYDKQVFDLSARQRTNETAVEELNRKLDVATAILSRIDAKLNHP